MYSIFICMFFSNKYMSFVKKLFNVSSCFKSILYKYKIDSKYEETLINFWTHDM